MKKHILFALVLLTSGCILAQKAPALSEAYLKQSVTCMLAEDSVLWFGTTHGLLMYHIKKGSKTLVKKGSLTQFTGISSITPDSKGNKWIMTTDQKIIRYSLSGAQSIPLPGNMPEGARLYAKKDKVFMVGETEYPGETRMAIYLNGAWVEKKDSLLKKSDFHCVDEMGNLWLIHKKNRDLWKYDLVKWTNYGQEDGVSWMDEYDDTRLNSVIEVPEKKEAHMTGGFLYFCRTVDGEYTNWTNKYEIGFGYDTPGVFYRKLVLDKEKHPWVGTDNGFFYEGTDGWNKKEGLDIVDMYFNENNQLVMLTADYGFHPDENNLFFSSVKINHPDSVETLISGTELMNDLACIRKSIFVHSDKYLFKITGRQIDTINLTDNFIPLATGAAYEKATGSVLISTDDGLLYLKKGEFTGLPYIDSKYNDWFHNDFFSDMEMYNGMMYATVKYDMESEASDGPSPYNQGGLAYIDKGVINFNYAGNDQIKDGELLCSCDSLLWMYSDDHNYLLYYWDANQDKVVDSVSGFPTEKYIESLVCKNDSGLYVIFEDEIALLTQQGIKNYFRDSISLLNDLRFKGGFYDSKYRLWIVASNGSLAKFINNKWTVIRPPSEEAYVVNFTMDKLNRIWISTENSILMYDGTKWNNLSKSLNLPDCYFYTLEYANDKIYAYSDSLGLIVISIN